MNEARLTTIQVQLSWGQEPRQDIYRLFIYYMYFKDLF